MSMLHFCFCFSNSLMFVAGFGPIELVRPKV